jgi:hypothetical protein
MFTNKMQSNDHHCYCAICDKTNSSRAKRSSFRSVLIASSNHLDEKLVPLIVRHFHAEKCDGQGGMKRMTKMLPKSFTHFTKENINAVNIKCLISSCLALPGYNAPIERVFQ